MIDVIKIDTLYSILNSESHNFDKKLKDLEKILNSWKRRKLTLLGKINIVKSLGLSELIYNALVLSLPENFSKRVDKTILDFIWDNKSHKIKTDTLIGDRDVGGLKMSEFESMNKALKASWVRRFNTEVNAPWKIIANYTTRHLGGFKFLLSCNYKAKELNLNSIPCFYSEILNCWEMKAEIDQEKKDPYNVIIWNNQEIKIATRPMFYESWRKTPLESQ